MITIHLSTKSMVVDKTFQRCWNPVDTPLGCLVEKGGRAKRLWENLLLCGWCRNKMTSWHMLPWTILSEVLRNSTWHGAMGRNGNEYD